MLRKTKGKDEGAWQEPAMKALDETLKQILKVPKTELDRRLLKEREQKRKQP